MRKTFLVAALLAGFAVWSAAQQANSNSPAQNPSPSSPATVRGCLTGASGQYRLVDDNHLVYMLISDGQKLNGFDGQQVQVTGQLQERIPPKEKQTESSFTGPERRLSVASISKISDSCTGASE